MELDALTTREIIQIAYVVKDLEEAATRFMRIMGVGPFFVLENPKISDGLYRGHPSDVQFSTAISHAGDVQVELVAQHCDSPSCYRDLIPEGEEGFHHIAVIVDDYQAEIDRYANLGFDVASSGRMGDMEFSYVDTSQSILGMTEVLQSRPFIEQYFENLHKACETWDGSRPIRDASELFP